MTGGIVLQNIVTKAGRKGEDVAGMIALNTLDKRLVQLNTKEEELLQRMREQVAELHPKSKVKPPFLKIVRTAVSSFAIPRLTV